MKLQESFLELKNATIELEKAVKEVKSRACDTPPDQQDYLVRYFTDKSIDLLNAIQEAGTHADNGCEAAEKPDVVKANKNMEGYDSCLKQITDISKSQIETGECFQSLLEKQHDEHWHAYATDLINAIEEARKNVRNVWAKFNTVNRDLREQNTISLASTILVRADELIPEIFHTGNEANSAERFYNMMSTLSCDSAPANWGGPNMSYSSYANEQDATALINNTMSTIFGNSLSPSSTAEDKKRFSSQVKNTLNRFLARKEENGNVRYELQQGYFGPATPVAGKEITGRQATLYQLAKTIQQSSKELLKSLVPISSETDIQDVVFLKESIATAYVGVVEEFGRVAGPVTERVDSLLVTIESELRLLKERLGIRHIRRTEFNELKDVDVASLEQTISNFALLMRYRQTLQDAWEGDDLANGKLENASGTNIAKLTNVVQSIPATVAQINWTMDMSGFGQADRDSTPLELAGTLTTIGGALKWIGVFAEQDCYPKLRDRDARLSELKAFETTFEKQVALIDKIIEKLHPFKAQANMSNDANILHHTDLVPPVLGTPRVMRALYELHQSLVYAQALVVKIVSLDKRKPIRPAVAQGLTA